MARFIDYLNSLLAGEDLTHATAGDLLDTIFAGDVPEAQIAAFLTAMRIKGATPAEVAGFAGSLRRHAVKVPVKSEGLIDTCGTGGGSVKTCNVSTAAALVAAGAGLSVAKHGNRGITSGCGSADVLEALGVKIDAGPDKIAECIEKAGVGFMFAPMFHPAMKYVQPIRKALGFRTVFNILGPLANPAGVRAQVLGVADAALMECMVESLQLLGATRAMVVHSDGLDEISTLGPTQIVELKEGRISRSELDPRDLGISPATVEQVLELEIGQISAPVRETFADGDYYIVYKILDEIPAPLSASEKIIVEELTLRKRAERLKAFGDSLYLAYAPRVRDGAIGLLVKRVDEQGGVALKPGDRDQIL
ncbi:MAG: anthranilate phosphoribosyltransferase, partial [Planctomycetes bacterium]|nr:anthranilate phosphoribosyltransferase [Planctomycetota bacterium]